MWSQAKGEFSPVFRATCEFRRADPPLVFRVILKINVKIVSSKPIQDHVNVLNVSLGRSDAPRTGGFGQERPSLDLREDENGGCNDRD